VAFALGLFSLLLPAPFFYLEREKLPSVFFKNPSTLFFLLFLLVGLGFILYAVVKFIRERSVFKEVKVFNKDLSPRGVLEGVIRLKSRKIRKEALRLTLVLQKAYIISERELRVGELPIWSQSIESVPYTAGDNLEVPFKFELGDEFTSYDEWEEGYELVLVLEGDSLGAEVFFIEGKGNPARGVYHEEEVLTPGSKTAGEILAERAYSNPWYGVLTSSFVFLFPLFTWFVVRGDRVFEREALERFLLGGFLGVATFFLPIYLLVKKIREGNAKERKEAARGILRLAFAFAGLSLAGWGYVLLMFFRGEGKLIDSFLNAVELYFVDGILGMFFLLGVYALLISLKELLVRERRIS